MNSGIKSVDNVLCPFRKQTILSTPKNEGTDMLAIPGKIMEISTEIFQPCLTTCSAYREIESGSTKIPACKLLETQKQNSFKKKQSYKKPTLKSNRY